MINEIDRKNNWLNKAGDRYYRICRVSFIFGLVQHAVFIFLFRFLGAEMLSNYNILSVFLFVIALFLNERRHFYTALTIAYVEIVIHQVIATWFLGWESGFHLYILFCIMLPQLTSRGYALWKLFIAGSSAVIYLALFFMWKEEAPQLTLSSMTVETFSGVNTISFIAILVLIAHLFNEMVLDFEEKLEKEFQYARNLLLNILPEPITRRLGKGTEPIADGIEEASVLFADIVGFTEFAEKISAEMLVGILDKLFAKFDLLCDLYNCEKIKTIGDAYMVACGVPEEVENNAEEIIRFAQAMLDELAGFNREEDMDIQIRIGIHTGPLAAGVIGRRKFSYDLWGDTVNIAARMESTGIPGRIQITSETRDACPAGFSFTSRGLVKVKGKGVIEIFLVDE